MKHDWNGPYPCPETGTMAPERRRFNCARCGSSVVCCAFGRMPERMEFGIDYNKTEKYPNLKPGLVHEDLEIPYVPREITGWQTPDESAVECKISIDCDIALTTRIMEK